LEEVSLSTPQQFFFELPQGAFYFLYYLPSLDVPEWPKPNTSTMSRQLPGTRYQATSYDVVMSSDIVNVFLVSDRL
jgi:hypothetical protein